MNRINLTAASFTLSIMIFMVYSALDKANNVGMVIMLLLTFILPLQVYFSLPKAIVDSTQNTKDVINKGNG